MFRLNSKGQMGAVEGIIIVVLMVSLGGVIYLMFKKDSSPQIYQAGSKPLVSDITNKPLCGIIFDITDRGKSESIVNKTGSH